MRRLPRTRPELALAILVTTLPLACGDEETGGGGGLTPCQVDAECASDDPCSIRTCGDDGKCHAEQAQDGESPQQVVGDCARVMCQGGLAFPEADYGDVDDDHEPCTLDRCGAAGPEHVPQIDDLPCVVGLGGGVCLDGVCKVACVMIEGSNQCDDLRDCTADTCAADGFCAHENLTGELPETSQITGDCHQLVCDEGEVVDEVDDTDAPDDGDICTNDLCKSGDPLHEDVAPGAKASEDPSPGDCASYFCPADGGPEYEQDDSDVPIDADPCTADMCTDGSPSNPAAEQGTPCGSGKVCDGQGACCTQITCASVGAVCGNVPDGCNGTISCGSCAEPEWCGGGGVDHQCGCAPTGQDGPRQGTVAANITSIGSVPWESLENIAASDGLTVQIPGMSGSDVSHWLKVSGYGFEVPSFAVVEGITVEWRRGGKFLQNSIADNAVRIVKGGAIGSTDRAKTTIWGGLTSVSYGSSSDVWGESWTPSQINSSTFGAALSAKYVGTSGNDWAEVDSARITVHFSVAGCP